VIVEVALGRHDGGRVLGSVRRALEDALGRLGSSACVTDALPSSFAIVSLGRWRTPELDLLKVDAQLHEREDRGSHFGLLLETSGPDDAVAVRQVLERYQRLFPLARSPDDHVQRVLQRLGASLDLRKPLVRADYDHALDAWRWLLRLAPDASSSLQLAALLHDLERFESEADARVEHLALDYQRFKDAHARRGALRAALLLMSEGLPRVAVARTCELIERHEAPGADPELALLNDADALSFFSLNSWGFQRYFGPEHTRRKVEYTLRRLSPGARHHLAGFRYHPQVESILRELWPFGAGFAERATSSLA